MDRANTLQHVALVADSKSVDLRDITRVSAALQKQVSRDFGPYWGIDATVDAFSDLEDVPVDYWPIVVRDDIHAPGAAGIHLDKDGQPFALVQFSDGWSLTASHELLEMLCDPTGNKVIAGHSPKTGQGRVLFLVEVCDPCEDAKFSYTVNGVPVSDFYTRHYFDPVTAAGARYSYTGAITKPRQVLQGGYISWHDPRTDHWFQETFFGQKPEFRDLGPLSQKGSSFRDQIYLLTPEAPKFRQPVAGLSSALLAAQDHGAAASGAKAKALRQEIGKLLAKK
jgi:hypothetical protein